MLATAAVTADYVHREKRATPREGMTVGKAHLKWSNIGYADAPVPAEIEALAREHVRKVGAEDDIGFVILHRCGGGNFYFLGVQTWRGQNEVWETVYAKTGPDDPHFKLWPYQTAHRGTFCVWELGVVWHEKQAWVRFLNSSRDEADLQRYLDDRYEGAV